MPRVDELLAQSPASVTVLKDALGVNTAQTAATTADGKAVAAQTTADSAVAAATAADGKADAAQAAIESVDTKATNALSNAATALSTAQGAATAAGEASDAAAAAQSTADGLSASVAAATTAANEASGDAATALTAAQTAQTTADQAVTDAATAQSTANSAASAASTAQTAADTADGKAVAAQTAANNAQTAADQAVTDAAAALSAAQAAQTTADSAVTDATEAFSLAQDVQTAQAAADLTIADLLARLTYLESVVESNAPVEQAANTAVPTLDGPKAAGELVTATPGTWTGDPTPVISRQWYLDGAPLSGATGLTYQTSAGQAGGVLTIRETGNNGGTPVVVNSAGLTLGAAAAPTTVTKTFSGTNGTDVVVADTTLSYIDDGSDSFLVIQDNEMAPGNMVGGGQGVYVNDFQFPAGQARKVDLVVGDIDPSGSYFVLCVASDPTGQNQLTAMIGNGYALIEQTVAGTPTTLSGSEHYPTVVAGDVITMELNAAGNQVSLKKNGTDTVTPRTVPVAIDAGAVYGGVGFYSADTTEVIRITSFTLTRIP